MTISIRRSRRPSIVTACVLIGTALVAVACSSEEKGTTTSTSSASTRTCADLAKCCDSLAEPNKSACTAAVGPKVEQACAASYDKICVKSDGGAAAEAGTAEGGSEENPCRALQDQCAECENPKAKADCEGYARDPAYCSSLVQADVYNARGPQCSPPDQN